MKKPTNEFLPQALGTMELGQSSLPGLASQSTESMCIIRRFGVIYYTQAITLTVNKQFKKVIAVTLLPDPWKMDWAERSLSELG